jgi:microcystin-dependent protein
VAIGEMPSHQHEANDITDERTDYYFYLVRNISDNWVKRIKVNSVSDGTYTVLAANTSTSGSYGEYDVTTSIRTKATGGGLSHNNLQPYLSVFLWQRLA